MGKITFYRISITTQTKHAHPDMSSCMTMISGNSQKITILKITKLLLFSILWHNLSKFITQRAYIAVSC